MTMIAPSEALSARARSECVRSWRQTSTSSAPCSSSASASVSPAWASSGSVNVHHGTKSVGLVEPGKNMLRTAPAASKPAEWVNRKRPARSPTA